MFHLDTWRIAKNNMCVASRRLEALGRYLELGKKSVVEGNLWLKAAMSGDKETIDAIVAHNIQDVILLEKLICILFPYTKSIGRM